eukprot:RCo004415
MIARRERKTEGGNGCEGGRENAEETEEAGGNAYGSPAASSHSVREHLLCTSLRYYTSLHEAADHAEIRELAPAVPQKAVPDAVPAKPRGLVHEVRRYFHGDPEPTHDRRLGLSTPHLCGADENPEGGG